MLKGRVYDVFGNRFPQSDQQSRFLLNKMLPSGAIIPAPELIPLLQFLSAEIMLKRV